MALSEFDLIKRFFDKSQPPTKTGKVKLGIGDDCAIASVPPQYDLVMTVDTLVEGVHFSPLFSPEQVGWFSLAVSLSDLASMGAEPAWFTLAITAPEADSKWFGEFSRGLFECSAAHSIELVGGDTTQGARTISIQAHGLVPINAALRRDAARPGDAIFVSGEPGAARAGLEILLEEQAVTHPLTNRLIRPSPRVELGQRLRALANAAIDISDGLVADLGHILKRSQVGAKLSVDDLPLDERALQRFGGVKARDFALYGGDDYELCFSVPPDNIAAVQQVSEISGVRITQIGEIVEGGELILQEQGEQLQPEPGAGFQHFRSSDTE